MTITANGASGTTYTLELHPLNTTFRALGGVYLVLNQTGTAYNAVYVGHTGNLSERFDSHHKADCWTQHSANCIAILLEGTEQRRLVIERDLINGLNPPCNG